MNAQVLGISVDDVATQARFAKENGLAFPLLSDQNKEVSRTYGVLLEDRGIANRATFVIDRSGKIQSIEAGNSAISTDGALAALKALK